MISKTPDGADRLVINITVGASEISENFIEENNTIYSNQGGVIPAGFPDVCNLIKALVGTA